MTSKRVPVSSKRITRGQLPAFERRGVVAQEVPGGELIVVTLHQAKIDFETIDGVAAEVPSVLHKLDPGVADTILLGSVSGGGTLALVDLIMLEGKSYRGQPWVERIEVLEMVVDKLPEDVRSKLKIASTWKRGLMKVFDAIEEGGGMGLLLREKGKPSAILCTGR